MDTPQANIGVGDISVTASDITEAITWLATHMGTQFTFTQGMRNLSNPLAAWSAKKGYKGLKKHPGDSTTPAKGKILDYLSTAAERRTSAPGWPGGEPGRRVDLTAAQLASAPLPGAVRYRFSLIEAGAGNVPLPSGSFDLAVSECGASARTPRDHRTPRHDGYTGSRVSRHRHCNDRDHRDRLGAVRAPQTQHPQRGEPHAVARLSSIAGRCSWCARSSANSDRVGVTA